MSAVIIDSAVHVEQRVKGCVSVFWAAIFLQRFGRWAQ